jgi:hypothetical protein
MNKELVTYIVCVSILIGSAIAGFTVYNLNERNNFAKNMESAISKGVDPLSVKCAYEQLPTATCITYALGKK